MSIHYSKRRRISSQHSMQNNTVRDKMNNGLTRKLVNNITENIVSHIFQKFELKLENMEKQILYRQQVIKNDMHDLRNEVHNLQNDVNTLNENLDTKLRQNTHKLIDTRDNIDRINKKMDVNTDLINLIANNIQHVNDYYSMGNSMDNSSDESKKYNYYS